MGAVRSGVSPTPMGFGSEVTGKNNPNFGFGGLGQASSALSQMQQPQNPNFGFGGFGNAQPQSMLQPQPFNFDPNMLGQLGQLFSVLFQGQEQGLGQLFQPMNPMTLMPGVAQAQEVQGQTPNLNEILQNAFRDSRRVLGGIL